MPRKSRFAVQVPLTKGGKRRPARVADLIRNELAMLLIRKVKDPRLHGVTITSVSVTDDLRLARIYYSCSNEKADAVAAGIDHTKGFFRSHLARELDLRYVPQLIFTRDPSMLYHEEMNKIFSEIEKENEA